MTSSGSSTYRCNDYAGCNPTTQARRDKHVINIEAKAGVSPRHLMYPYNNPKNFPELAQDVNENWLAAFSRLVDATGNDLFKARNLIGQAVAMRTGSWRSEAIARDIETAFALEYRAQGFKYGWNKALYDDPSSLSDAEVDFRIENHASLAERIQVSQELWGMEKVESVYEEFGAEQLRRALDERKKLNESDAPSDPIFKYQPQIFFAVPVDARYNNPACYSLIDAEVRRIAGVPPYKVLPPEYVPEIWLINRWIPLPMLWAVYSLVSRFPRLNSIAWARNLIRYAIIRRHPSSEERLYVDLDPAHLFDACMAAHAGSEGKLWTEDFYRSWMSISAAEREAMKDRDLKADLEPGLWTYPRWQAAESIWRPTTSDERHPLVQTGFLFGLPAVQRQHLELKSLKRQLDKLKPHGSVASFYLTYSQRTQWLKDLTRPNTRFAKDTRKSPPSRLVLRPGVGKG